MDNLVKAAVAALVALAVIEEILYVRQRFARAAAGWWAGVEHRDRAQLEKAELGFLIRRLNAR